jgi:putative Holliday junction resolvase
MHARILAIDYGHKRHGLAVSDGLGLVGHPLPALQRASAARDLEQLRHVIDEHDVRRLVVGLPLNMDGSEGPMAAEARTFAAGLERELGLPVLLEDERLSTDEAESLLREGGLRPSERKALRDSVAAAVILRGVLDREAAGPQP